MRMRPTMALALVAGLAATVAADEGMWLYSNPPKAYLKKTYGFEPTAEWLEHVQKSSVRFNSGGSGSFVSADGLVMTNHHVGADALQKMSSAEHNYMRDGFYAKSRSEEVKCLDLELNVLMSIEDVTQQVNAAVKDGMAAKQAFAARRAVMSEIEKTSTDKTGLRSDVVTLYQGGQYHLYRFKKYTDIRLVFAPEQDMAFFGGDPDNFEYPRYDLDICFFHVYENGQPLKPQHFLKWSANGCAENELTFVSGHPGRTSRLNTVAHLEFLRDKTIPATLDLLRRKEVLLSTYSERGSENQRRAREDLFSIQNSRKARIGGLGGLQDPAVMAKKVAAEKDLRDIVDRDTKLKAKYGDAWDIIAATLKEAESVRKEYNFLERGNAFYSESFKLARDIVRLTEEVTKPNAERLREYRESALESLKQELYSEAPIHNDLERIKLADSLGHFMESMGANDEWVKRTLAGQSPTNRAAQLVNGTKLHDVAFRKQLVEGGKKAVEASTDPMIQLARLVDAPARYFRKIYEEKVDEPQRQAYAKIANALFAVKGTDIYPDATFTLRLAFGTCKGFRENGKDVPWATTLGGTYQHADSHENKQPFKLPKRWLERKDKLELNTPFNFVSTADIIGGNSGSPVVNKAGELVGIIFDGNLQSLVLDFQFTDEVARSVSVHSAGIIEALKKVYEADGLVAELQGKTNGAKAN